MGGVVVGGVVVEVSWGDTVTVRVELSHDGTSWDDDLTLTFRRTAGTA